jgi:uncharacterized protein (TIGR02453 family)
LTEEVLQGLKVHEPSLSHLKAKDCVFRINRDVRFSPDKSPYKRNFSAYICTEGRKSFAPGYYLHLQPGQSFLAGGIYMPGSEWLRKIRQELDYNPEPLAAYLKREDVQAHFGDMQGERLKRAPKGYTEDHPHIEWLKHKSFLLQQSLADEQLEQKEISSFIAQSFQLLRPFLDYFRMAVEEDESEEGL